MQMSHTAELPQPCETIGWDSFSSFSNDPLGLLGFNERWLDTIERQPCVTFRMHVIEQIVDVTYMS